MKTNVNGRGRQRLRRTQGRGGYATVVVLALAILMVVFVLSGQRTVDRLKREVRLLEERQSRHWILGPPTNTIVPPPAQGDKPVGQ